MRLLVDRYRLVMALTVVRVLGGGYQHLLR